MLCQASIDGREPGTRKGCHYISLHQIKVDRAIGVTFRGVGAQFIAPGGGQEMVDGPHTSPRDNEFSYIHPGIGTYTKGR